MEDLQPLFQSLAATLAQLTNRGSVEEITVLAVVALVIAGPLLSSLCKFISNSGPPPFDFLPETRLANDRRQRHRNSHYCRVACARRRLALHLRCAHVPNLF